MMALKFLYRSFFIQVIIFFLVGCGNAKPESENSKNEAEAVEDVSKQPVIPVFASYKAAIMAMRAGKNEAVVARQTIEPENVKDFKGLKYYDPDSTYILKATLELLKPEKVVLKTTDTRAPEYYKFCKLSFDHKGEKGVLTGYVDNIESPESIFIPFKDVTSNKETYGGGRYIDLDYHGEKTMMLLDFNYAYNPYCHYNHNYSCPLVPEENILTIPILAGEKKLYE